MMLQENEMKKIILLILPLLIQSYSTTICSASKPLEGKEYNVIGINNKKVNSDIVVDEFFSYACPHCYTFQPIINSWKKNKPNGVKFIQTPAVFNDRMIPMAKVFFSLEELDLLTPLHISFYKAIHEKQKKLFTREAIFKWFESKKDVDFEKFKTTFDSFSIQSKVNTAKKKARKYKLPGTPYIIVNGKFITGPSMTVSDNGKVDSERLGYVLNYLINSEKN